MSYEEKLINFIYKLYNSISDNPAIAEACGDREADVVVELSLGDVPNVVWQIGCKNKKWFVNKGSIDKSNAGIQYYTLKLLDDWWSGKLGSDGLFQQGAITLLHGDFSDLGFMVPVEQPVKDAYQKIKNEFPGLPK